LHFRAVKWRLRNEIHQTLFEKGGKKKGGEWEYHGGGKINLKYDKTLLKKELGTCQHADFLVVMWFELRVLCLLGKCSITWAMTPVNDGLLAGGICRNWMGIHSSNPKLHALKSPSEYFFANYSLTSQLRTIPGIWWNMQGNFPVYNRALPQFHHQRNSSVTV
jgi:hypothetical protein